MSEEKIDGLITVRTSSTRLPEKCLLQFGEGNVIEHIIRRAKAFGINPIVCTSIDKSDDILEKIAFEEGVRCFRGSLNNKLKRWSDCATQFNLNYFHSVDADDPFFDGEEMKLSMSLLYQNDFDMIYPSKSSSSGGASVGYSLTSKLVKQVSSKLSDESDTEMMWYFIEKEIGLRSMILPESSLPNSKIRLTLDYIEDYWLLDSVRRIVGNLAQRKEINQLFIRNPDMYKINWFRNEEWQSGQLAKKPT